MHHISNSAYRPDIDGLRALAVLSVVAFHAFPNWVTGGFVGVDVFFVISGFLISSLLFTSLENNTFSFFDFYQRRIKRIFPALLITLVFCSLLGWFALFPDEYQQLGKHIAGGAGFISNFILWKETGYFDNNADTKPLLHLWSLGIEEQFYIIWPLLLWAAWKRKFNFFTLILVFATISFIVNLLFIHSHAEATFYLPQARFWELLCGSLLAWVVLYKPSITQQFTQETDPKLKHHLCSILGFLLTSFAILSFSKQTIFPGAWAMIPVLGAVLIILAGPKAWFNRTFLCHPLLIWFGLISFPLYLWHWPLLSFARILDGDIPSRASRVIVILLSILLAWLTYHLIEKPIRWGNKASATKLLILILLMTGMGSAGYYIKRHEGLSARFKNNQELLALRSTPANSKITFIPCGDLVPQFKQFKFDGACLISKNAMPDTLLLGDSHALHYINAMGNQFSKNSVLAISQTSCLPFSYDGFLKDDCKKKYEAILSFLETNTSIKKVYASGYWAYLMTGGFSKNGTNWRNAKPVNDLDAKSFIANGKQFFTRVLKTGKELVFLKDIPDLDFNINYCYVSRPLTLPSSHPPRKKCWLDFASYAKRTQQYDKVISQLLTNYPQIKVYNPRSLFCNDKHCIVRDNKLPYYANGDHLNSYGATMVMKDLQQKLVLNQEIALTRKNNPR